NTAALRYCLLRRVNYEVKNAHPRAPGIVSPGECDNLRPGYAAALELEAQRSAGRGRIETHPFGLQSRQIRRSQSHISAKPGKAIDVDGDVNSRAAIRDWSRRACANREVRRAQRRRTQ